LLNHPCHLLPLSEQKEDLEVSKVGVYPFVTPFLHLLMLSLFQELLCFSVGAVSISKVGRIITCCRDLSAKACS